MRRAVKRAGLPTAVFVIALGVFTAAAGQVPFWGDESSNLTPVRYFRLFFVEWNISDPEWGDNYFTHTQPIIHRYLLGGWLWFRGYELESMPRRYDFTNSYAENQRKGRVPDDALLADARAPMVLFAAGAVTVLFLLGSALGGTVAGLVSAALVLASPLAREHLVRAMEEAPLVFFALLTLYVGVVGSARSRAGSLPVRWAVPVGVALAVAVGTKLTALLSLAAVVAWIGLIAIARVGSHPPSPKAGPRPALVGLLSGWILALAVAAVVFVVTYPHLYPNPIVHSLHLLQHRLDDETRRQREVPGLAVRDPFDRAARVARHSLVDGTASGSAGVPLEAALAALGAIALVWRTSRRWQDARHPAPEAYALLTAAAYFGGTIAGLFLDYSRYYVPTLVFGALLSGVGCQALVALARTALHRRHALGARPVGATTALQSVAPAAQTERPRLIP